MRFNKLISITVLIIMLVNFWGVGVLAVEEQDPDKTSQEEVTTTTTTTTTTTSSKTTKASDSDNSDNSGGSTKRTTTKKTTTTTSKNKKQKLKFSDSNKKKVAMADSIILEIETSNIDNLSTKFKSSDTTIAKVEKIDNLKVKVVGLREGTVNITASSSGVSDKIKITVTAASGTSDNDGDRNDQQSSQTGDDGIVGGVSDEDNTAPSGILEIADDEQGEDGTVSVVQAEDLPPLEPKADPFEDITYEKKGNIWSTIFGIMGWIAVISGVVIVVMVIMRSNGPRGNRYRGSVRTRAGGYPHRSRKKLPDKYYRNLKKW